MDAINFLDDLHVKVPCDLIYLSLMDAINSLDDFTCQGCSKLISLGTYFHYLLVIDGCKMISLMILQVEVPYDLIYLSFIVELIPLMILHSKMPREFTGL